MSGSVIVIKPPVPEWLACDHVQVHAAASLPESYICQLQIADRDYGKMILHNLWNLAKGISPGNVRRAFIEPCSRICQEQVAFLKFYIRIRR